ncbi:hypothetical protein BLNAU_19854 [Blattamonas nauphoetae]|uniref:Uncharacterized protein n=1 Tax=Blattamonas nauphoetae TaxID=2049346 RepID=A0ABQ9X0C4_9EUKA|nr:hypothetical protein BLNAU_19854 [Blattamonas nauphoetae]
MLREGVASEVVLGRIDSAKREVSCLMELFDTVNESKEIWEDEPTRNEVSKEQSAIRVSSTERERQSERTKAEDVKVEERKAELEIVWDDCADTKKGWESVVF